METTKIYLKSNEKRPLHCQHQRPSAEIHRWESSQRLPRYLIGCARDTHPHDTLAMISVAELLFWNPSKPRWLEWALLIPTGAKLAVLLRYLLHVFRRSLQNQVACSIVREWASYSGLYMIFFSIFGSTLCMKYTNKTYNTGILSVYLVYLCITLRMGKYWYEPLMRRGGCSLAALNALWTFTLIVQ